MPLIVAIAVRYIVMAAVQLGLWSLIERYGIPLLNDAIVAVAKAFGVSDETARDIVANKVLVAFEEVGIFAATLRSKLPIKAAELLGFTSKGFVRRTIPAKTAATVAAAEKTAVVSATATAETATAVAATVAKTRGISLATVKTVLGIVATVIGVPTGFFFAFAQYIDFANWQGPYQKYFQRILSYLGIHPDTPIPRARTISQDTWSRILATVEELHPIGLSFPFSGKDTPWSREDFADLVDEVAANLTKAGGQSSYKNVIGIVLPLVQLSGQAPTPVSAAIVADVSQTAKSVKPVKVFTGVVTQGTLGAAVAFAPRQNDLIESVKELKTAAENNLASFIASLPGRIIYELKIVTSVTTKDGFTQRGAAQQVIVGYNTKGEPRYKTILNRFAVVNLFATTEKGARTKLATVVLGPTDSVKLQPTGAQLAAVESSIKSDLFTSDIGTISGIQTAAPITVVPPEPQLPAAPTLGLASATPSESSFSAPVVAQTAQPKYAFDGVYYTDRNAPFQQLYKETADALLTIQPADLLLTREEKARAGNFGEQSTLALQKLRDLGFREEAVRQDQNIPDLRDRTARAGKQFRGVGLEEFFGGLHPAPTSQPPPPASMMPPSAVCGAKTLFEYYTSLGQSLPGVGERAKVYAALSLGVESYYTGTAEQNVKLLSELQRLAGCPK